MTDLAYPPGAVTWFVPGVALWLVIGLVAARAYVPASGEPRALVFLLVISVGVILSATLTPIQVVGDFVPQASCDLERFGPPSLGSMQTLNDTSLNVLLFVPLGLAVALLRRSRQKALLVVAALAFPFVIEGLQMTIPALGRGCQTADVIDNLVGLLIGLAVGSIIGTIGSLGRRPAGR